MKRRDFLKISGGMALSFLPLAVFCKKFSQSKPNIVFILIDDLGWRDVSFMGSHYYETPNIDRLAREGIVFTNAYANAPNCAPTRASLLTGQYTPRHGIYTVGNPARGKAHLRKLIPVPNKTVLDPDKVTIAEVLKSAGYVTAHVGKWHLGKDPDSGPQAQGFDVNIGGNQAGHPKSYFSPYHNNNLSDGPEGEYLTDRLTKEALQFIKQNSDKPFFLYFSHYAVHTPIQAKPELIQKYRKKPPWNGHKNPTYAAMIESVDESVGQILKILDELNLTEKTIIVFFSDNGGYGPVTSMAPLRGSKGMLYEGGIREPLVVRWPGKIPAGSKCDTPVIGIDFFPTFLEILGLSQPPDHPLDGESLVPLLFQTGQLKRNAIFWHFPAYLEAYRDTPGPWRTTPAGAVRQGDWKLIEFFEDGRLELYNLKNDISESRNLAGEMPEKTAELHQLLKDWRKSLNAPVPTELNPKYNPGKKKG